VSLRPFARLQRLLEALEVSGVACDAADAPLSAQCWTVDGDHTARLLVPCRPTGSDLERLWLGAVLRDCRAGLHPAVQLTAVRAAPVSDALAGSIERAEDMAQRYAMLALTAGSDLHAKRLATFWGRRVRELKAQASLPLLASLLTAEPAAALTVGRPLNAVLSSEDFPIVFDALGFHASVEDLDGLSRRSRVLLGLDPGDIMFRR
jgi:hypothetical protein